MSRSRRVLMAIAEGWRNPLLRNGYLLALSSGLTAVIGFGYWTVAARKYDAASVGSNSAAISMMVLRCHDRPTEPVERDGAVRAHRGTTHPAPCRRGILGERRPRRPDRHRGRGRHSSGLPWLGDSVGCLADGDVRCQHRRLFVVRHPSRRSGRVVPGRMGAGGECRRRDRQTRVCRRPPGGYAVPRHLCFVGASAGDRGDRRLRLSGRMGDSPPPTR